MRSHAEPFPGGIHPTAHGACTPLVPSLVSGGDRGAASGPPGHPQNRMRQRLHKVKDESFIYKEP